MSEDLRWVCTGNYFACINVAILRCVFIARCILQIFAKLIINAMLPFAYYKGGSIVVQEATGCKWCLEFAKQNGKESLVPLAQTIYLMMHSNSLEKRLEELEALSRAENHCDRNMKPLEHGLQCSVCGVDCLVRGNLIYFVAKG